MYFFSIFTYLTKLAAHTADPRYVVIHTMAKNKLTVNMITKRKISVSSPRSPVKYQSPAYTVTMPTISDRISMLLMI